MSVTCGDARYCNVRKRFGWAAALTASLCMLIAVELPATADDTATAPAAPPVDTKATTPATNNSAAAGNTTSATADSAAGLKGNVVAADLSILAALKELGEICHRVNKSSTDLLYESQRPNTVAIGGPTIIGNTIIPIAAAPGGVMNMGGYLPPRKKWVDYFVAEISQLFPLLETQITSASSPDNDPTATAVIADMKVDLSSMKPWYDRLLSDTKGPPYNNANISKDASALIKYSTHIDKDRKQLDRISKKAEKKAEKLEKRHVTK
jgi:hypothetical protein